jgi:hypothetical protein
VQQLIVSFGALFSRKNPRYNMPVPYRRANAMSSEIQQAIKTMTDLTPKQIRERLDDLETEEIALRVLLRSKTAQEQHQARKAARQAVMA